MGFPRKTAKGQRTMAAISSAIVAMRMSRLWAGESERCEMQRRSLSKDQHVRDRHDVKSRGIQPRRRETSGQRVGTCQETENDHRTGQQKTEYPQAAMDIHATGRNQSGLRD